ncbi:hypothetical protein NHP190012_09990 [Helicobacter sp. NHP19-012]|uniref:Uncharacterized protein n=1 Tax=Helicobacter gastrofelis TaxID=2849642 RepID=A0ABN6I8L0_9HELI|nr:hypothetical protein NHP190012_09990 [Helicobacter sp. NHP19-012]
MLQEGLEIGIRDCIENLQNVLTTQTEIDLKDKPQSVQPTIKVATTTKNNTIEVVPPQDSPKEIPQQEPQKALAPVVQKPTPKATKETTKAPILAKDLSIANRGKSLWITTSIRLI